jgi:hypothetical protein
MFQRMGVFAAFERAIIVERVNAGLARAKSAGYEGRRVRAGSRVAGQIRDRHDGQLRRLYSLASPILTVEEKLPNTLGDKIRAAGRTLVAAPSDRLGAALAAQLQQIITPPYRIETGAIADADGRKAGPFAVLICKGGQPIGAGADQQLKPGAGRGDEVESNRRSRHPAEEQALRHFEPIGPRAVES